MPSDKRELLLVVKGKDQGAAKTLDGVGDAAEGAKDDLQDMQVGLKKLDGQIAGSTAKVEALRKEINKSGDLGLVKDLERAQRELNKLTKQRKLLIPVELDVDKDDGLLDGLADLGGKGAGGFALGFSQKIGPLLARAPLSTPLLAGIAAASPFIAAAVGAAVTAGVGTAAVGAGLAIAARDPAVKKAGSELGKVILEDLETAAEPFVIQTVGALSDVRAEWKTVLPDIQDTFSAASAYVRPLTQALTGFAKNVLPGVRDAVRGAQPIIDVLRDEIPDIGDAIGDALSALADNGQDTASVLRLGFDVAESSIRATATSLDLLQSSLKIVGPLWFNIWSDMTETAEVTRVTRVSFEDLRGSLVSSEHAVEAMAERQEILNNTMSEGVDFAGGLKEALDILSGANLDLREAQRQVEEAIDGANEALKENGKTLKDSTAEGRANNAALDAIAEAYATQADAVYRSTEATQGADAATAAATKTLEAGRKTLIETYLQFDNNRARAEAYASAVLGIPTSWRTNVTANTGQANAALKDTKDILFSLKNRRVKVTIDYVKTGDYTGIARGYAQGGEVMLPGPKGRDSGFIRAAPGEYVLDAGDVDKLGGPRAIDQWRKQLDRGLMSYQGGSGPAGGGWGGGSGARVLVEARWAGGGGPLGDLGAALTRFIKLDVIELGGGDVQAAYGRRVNR